MTVSWPTTGSWALVAASAIALIAWALMRSGAQAERELQQRIEKRKDYERTKQLHNDALRAGDITATIKYAKLLNSMRRAGWHLIPVLISLIVTGCCRHTLTTKTPTIPIGDHIILPQPGDIVPPYPDGETIWWLCTPTGLSFILPEDSPILHGVATPLQQP